MPKYQYSHLARVRTLLTLSRALVLTATAVLSIQAAAADYPVKPIRLIVPFSAGGPTDVMARQLGPRLTETFKQSIVIDNRPGASGMIGIEQGVHAVPDGYTMLIVSSSYGASPALYQLPYDPVKDVTPIILLDGTPHLLAVHPSLPVRSTAELIAYDKANPGKVNYGSSGTGGSIHLATELFNQMAGTHFNHVPYKGQGPALNDVIAGQIQMMMASPVVLYPQVKAGRLRGLAVTTLKRMAAMPEFPTVSETVPGYEAASWQAILGPRGLPPAIVSLWNRETDRVLHTPDFRELMAKGGAEGGGGSPSRILEVLTRDVEKWRRVVKAGNIRLAE